MRTRKLGYSDLRLTVIGFGAWALGGGGRRTSYGNEECKGGKNTKGLAKSIHEIILS